MIPRLCPDFDLSFRDLRKALPALAFFGGFAWDAMTLGRSVTPLDLWLLAAYLASAAAILRFLGRRQAQAPSPGAQRPDTAPGTLAAKVSEPPWWRVSGPYLLLQFCFGGLFSALFIFYFKSSSHLLAYAWALGLGGLLVANEFLEDRYRRFTLTWALFGLCAMLLLNFAVPHVVGSVAGFWFYLSTLLGAVLAHGLRHATPGRPGRIGPVWGVAVALVLAYAVDAIPPVPLVKRDLAVGHHLVKAEGAYRLLLEKAPWWVFWRREAKATRLAPGERLYCVSAVFAPSGLSARLYHRWEYREAARGWITYSRIGFSLAGGREGGYRGYTFKQNLAAGDWRVSVETENERTLARHRFRIAPEPLPADAVMLTRSL